MAALEKMHQKAALRWTPRDVAWQRLLAAENRMYVWIILKRGSGLAFQQLWKSASRAARAARRAIETYAKH